MRHDRSLFMPIKQPPFRPVIVGKDGGLAFLEDGDEPWRQDAVPDLSIDGLAKWMFLYRLPRPRHLET